MSRKKPKRGHRANGRGCFRIDRTFGGGVGRLALSSGTTSLAEFRNRNEMLTHLWNTGRLDILKALKARRLKMVEVCSAWRTDSIGYLASEVILFRDVWDAAAQWLEDLPAGTSTKRRYKTSFNALRRRSVLVGNAQVRDLRNVDWDSVRKGWANSPADWNHLRRAISHFLSVILGDKYHPFRREVMSHFPKATEPSGRIPDLTPELFWRIMDQIPQPLHCCYVTLVVTGMRVGEYLGCKDTDLRPNTSALRIPGTKTSGSDSVLPVHPDFWPDLVAAIPAPRRYRALYRHFKTACREVGMGGLTLHDLRHCTGQWLVDAGRPEASVQQTLRHKDPAMTRRYTKQRTKGEDALAIRQVLLDGRSRLRIA